MPAHAAFGKQGLEHCIVAANRRFGADRRRVRPYVLLRSQALSMSVGWAAHYTRSENFPALTRHRGPLRAADPTHAQACRLPPTTTQNRRRADEHGGWRAECPLGKHF